MKKLIYVFVSLILLSSLFPTVNFSAPASDLEITIESPEASEFDLVQSRAIILNRLEAYGISGAEITILPNRRQLLVKLPDETTHEPILPLLIAKGELIFSTVFSREELAKMLEDSPYEQQWSKWLTVDTGNLGRQGSSAILAELDRDEITAFSTFVAGPDIRRGLPPYLQFRFGRFPNPEDQLGVYALNFSKDDRILLSGHSVQEARAQANEATGEVAIYLTFYPEATQKWAEITRRNINRSIAVVIDDLVYFAPRVAAEIKEGKAQISGHFHMQEAQTLAAIIQGGELPVEFQLIGD